MNRYDWISVCSCSPRGCKDFRSHSFLFLYLFSTYSFSFCFHPLPFFFSFQSLRGKLASWEFLFFFFRGQVLPFPLWYEAKGQGLWGIGESLAGGRDGDGEKARTRARGKGKVKGNKNRRKKGLSSHLGHLSPSRSLSLSQHLV